MGLLSFKQGKFYFETVTSQEAARARYAGLKRDGHSLRWVTRNFSKARKLRWFADKSAERKLKNHFITSLEPPECIVYPDELSPRTWQMRSAWHCLTRSPAYCADEAGMGKTITAALCMNTIPMRTLIICPAHLKWNWFAEIQTWCDLRTVWIIQNAGEIEVACKHHTVILSDALLDDAHVRSILAKEKFTWLFVDEAHRYKTADAQRVSALLGDEKNEGIVDSCERLVFLSGTPIPNGKPLELYSLLSSVAPSAIGHRSFWEYGRDFCGARQVVRYEGRRTIVNTVYDGATNLGKLNKLLFSKLMIRHLKRDHLKELGPKTRQLIFLDTPKKVHALETKVLKHHSLDDLLGRDASLGDMATYRREVGESKIEPSFQFIKEVLESSNESLVVFGHHVEVVEHLNRLLSRYGSVMIRGGMNSKAKTKAVKRFQQDPKCRVIVGNLEAMGTGVTLTAASRLVIVEASWVPGVNEQAEDRIHRMTQKENVFCQYLVLRNSLDERMLRSVLKKQQAIDKVMAS